MRESWVPVLFFFVRFVDGAGFRHEYSNIGR